MQAHVRAPSGAPSRGRRRSLLTTTALATAALAIPTRAALAGSDAPGATVPAIAAPAPIRVELIIDDPRAQGASPAYAPLVRGVLDELRLVAIAPAASAEVTLFVSPAAVDRLDRVHLRAVGRAAGLPAQVDLDVDVDPRAAVDAQRAALRAGIGRVLASAVAVRFPDAVAIVPHAPVAVGARPASPYAAMITLAGDAQKSGPLSSANALVGVSLRRTTTDAWWWAHVTAQGTRAVDGQVDAATITYTRRIDGAVSAGFAGARDLAVGVSLGGALQVDVGHRWGDDTVTGRTSLGAEWNAFRSDDPRGNRLALTYLVSAVGTTGDAGDDRRLTQQLVASAGVRHDRATFGFHVGASVTGTAVADAAMVASGYLSLPVSPHVDLDVSGVVGRGSFWLAASGDTFASASFGLRIHLDATNGARNDRLSGLNLFW